LTDGIGQRQVVWYSGDIEETKCHDWVERNRDHSDVGVAGPSKILGDSTGQIRNMSMSIKSL
jgi:hypothetical protein